MCRSSSPSGRQNRDLSLASCNLSLALSLWNHQPGSGSQQLTIVNHYYHQAAPRVFVNDVIVRFHKTLELEEDEVKTLICRYPPPSAQAGEPGSIK